MNSQRPSPEDGNPALAHARQLTLAVYILHAVTSVTLVSVIVAVAINYSRRDRVSGTIYESHFEWQISTFWYSLLYFVLGVLLLVWGIVAWVGKGGGGPGLVILGTVLLFCNWCWHLYRVIRGLMSWNERKPIDA